MWNIFEGVLCGNSAKQQKLRSIAQQIRATSASTAAPGNDAEHSRQRYLRGDTIISAGQTGAFVPMIIMLR
jgi:hypothetical protein